MSTRVCSSYLLALALCCATAAAKESETPKRQPTYNLGSTWNDTFRIAARIDPRKGIGEFEAAALAEAYFGRYINRCGGTQRPRDRGDRWVADTMVGYGGAPGPKIIVEKRTGVTYSRRLPRVTNPKEYLKSIENI